MRRGWLLPAILGSVAVAIVVAVGLLWIRPFAPTADASPSDAVDAVPPDGVVWTFATQLPPEQGGAGLIVQAGILGEDRPRVDVEVPWAVDPNVDIARMPAVSRPVTGGVVFAADDGETSTVLRVAIEPGAAPEQMAAVDDTVWSLAAAPDGSAAYLALVERGRPEVDRGVVRVPLDGSGRVEEFLPPRAAAEPGPMRLVAVAPFSVTLDISRDGRYLARTTCRGVAGCETELVDLASRDRIVLEDLQLTDVGIGGMVIGDRCDVDGCANQLVEVETGASLELRSHAFDTTIVTIGGEPVVVGIETDGMASWLTATDPHSGASRELYRVPAGDWLLLASRNYSMTMPDGGVVVVHASDAGGEIRNRYVLVPVGGGDAIELPAPPVRQVGPPGAKG